MTWLVEMCITRISFCLQVPVTPSLGVPWVKQAKTMTAGALLQTPGWLGRDFLKIKMSKYSSCFSYFAYCSLDCFCQTIVGLPIGSVCLPSLITLVFSLLKKVFCIRGDMFSEKKNDLKPELKMDYYFSMMPSSCFTYSLWTVTLFCVFFLFFFLVLIICSFFKGT